MLDCKTEDYLFSLRRRGIKVGLHRTEALLTKCGNPHHDIPVIHIAGTNGKGSTASMIASILRESGRKVGLYTSPHLVRYNERIRINGSPIGDERIISFLEQHRDNIDMLGSTFFETTTALTFTHFAQEEVDVAVIEVGLGGRLDSTNVANTAVSVITPIDYDHMNFLGHDLKSIAKEKCGILKPQVPAVTAPQRDEVTKVILEKTIENGIPMVSSLDIVPIKDIRMTPSGSHFSVNGQPYLIPLLGMHQIINAQAALAACWLYDNSISTETKRVGLKNVQWPGRLQELSSSPLVYFDVAHNPHALEAVLNTLRELFDEKGIGCVCALKKNKDVELIARLLKQSCETVITTAPAHRGFFRPKELKARFAGLGVTAIAASDLGKALDHCDIHESDSDLWLIFGTHYLAEEVFQKFHFPFDKGKI